MTNGDVNERGEGWVLFAGVMILTVGLLNFLWGISAIANSHIIINGNHFDIDHRQAWGWTLLIISVIQIFVAFGIWSRQAWARWTGVFIAALNAIAVLADMQSFPFWSLAIFTVDLLIIYGLIAHGGRSRTAAT
jgi:uncharacterized membrane protein (DUF2068 family)